MRTNDIRTTAESNAVVNHFFPIYCIVVNHAAPVAVQDDEQALEYVWREIMCAGHHWNIDFLNTFREMCTALTRVCCIIILITALSALRS